MARGTRSTKVRGSDDDSHSKDARPYLTRTFARSLGAPPKQADEETEPPTLSQEARLTAHEEEVYYQGLELKADNAKLHQAQAKAEGEDPSWTLSQDSSRSFSRTNSKSSDISIGDDGDGDDTDEFKVPSSGDRATAYQQSRKGTSPPGSTTGGTTDAGDYDSGHENNDDEYDDDEYDDDEYDDDDDDDDDNDNDGGSQTDTERPPTKRDRKSSFPEDKLDAKKLREIREAFKNPTSNHPHKFFDKLMDEYELDRVDLEKAQTFAKDHEKRLEKPKSWKDSELLDVARKEWSMLLDNRY
ncbi:uncharacterized protein B0H18DRAFT_185074 [Fomitopsis serialis]|uniref:uncharacterized protein n=1 Tax=Fomitopsis serialis TaxID=139415 RepID=UPI002007E7EC|nr:uncharacterized protein B0H18DRAFT_185074 [Neoantrodia serialis]KAH9937033.1 hypothetical protein B0H18DRAFT_185074 [Neoantrodia serialis]